MEAFYQDIIRVGKLAANQTLSYNLLLWTAYNTRWSLNLWARKKEDSAFK